MSKIFKIFMVVFFLSFVGVFGFEITSSGCLDSDFDDFCDDLNGDGLINVIGEDMCPEVSGTSLYNGCYYEFTKDSNFGCTDAAIFYETEQKFFCDTVRSKTNIGFSTNFYPNTIQDIIESGDDTYYLRDLNFENKENGFFQCFREDDGFRGACKLQYNNPISCTITPLNLDIYDNSQLKLYSKRYVRFDEDCEDVSILLNIGCSETFRYFDISNYITNYPYQTCERLDFKYSSFDIYDGSNLYLVDDFSINKVYYNPELDKYSYFDDGGNFNDLNLDLEIRVQENMFIYKNEILDRKEFVDPIILALESHKIKKFHSIDDAKIFVESSVNLMQKFNIIKNLTFDGVNTNVKITLKNFTGTDGVKNLTVYQIIPKSIVANLSQINFISNGGAQRFVLDKDPIIGWYFNDSSGDEDIEFELPGDNEGGSIIIIQEPILFNEGELVVNYRETNCNVDEIQLFEVSGLEASNVYSSGTNEFYKVCLAHIDDEVNLFNDDNIQTLNIMKYFDAGETYISRDSGDINLLVSTDRGDLYWDLIIQEGNPTGNYSCLASVDDLNGSLIGDCGYNSKNRLWIHLGEDYYPPKTEVIIPFVAHVLRVTLNSNDEIGGSGFLSQFYCIDTDNSCDPFIDGTITTDNEITLPVTCSDDWGCTKYIRYSSEDIAGNVADVNFKKLEIIDQGSACQSDCMAKPSPNRYLKDCRNMNGCNFYDYFGDDGLIVADVCHMNIENSWVKLNDTHEIMCPLGPIRESVFTSELFKSHDSLCDNLVKIPYPVKYNGESIIMNVISCINY